MAATSNDDDFLSDPTSVRRFWVWVTDTGEEYQIDQDLLLKNLPYIWGEAFQAYLDLRAAQPRGELHLGLQDHEAIMEQRRIAEGNRKQTATETISEVISDWLEEEFAANEVLVDADGFAMDDADDRRMVRNMVSPRDVFEALRHDPVLASYRNADARTYAKALRLIERLTELPKSRRHGQNSVWFSCNGGTERWVEKAAGMNPQAETETDDLLS
jgi:hypothetical protein